MVLSGKVFGTEADYIIAEAEFPEGEGEEPEEVRQRCPRIHTHIHTHIHTYCTYKTHTYGLIVFFYGTRKLTQKRVMGPIPRTRGSRGLRRRRTNLQRANGSLPPSYQRKNLKRGPTRRHTLCAINVGWVKRPEWGEEESGERSGERRVGEEESGERRVGRGELIMHI